MKRTIRSPYKSRPGELSRRRKRLDSLVEQRERLERHLVTVLSRKKLIKASVVTKYKACNKKGCKCTRGELHGPFLYLSLSEGGRTRMVFIPQRLWEQVGKAGENYRSWRQGRARIVKINEQILEILDKIQEEITVSVKQVLRQKK